MRKNSCYFIVCALCVCMLSACGSSKNAVVSQQAVNPYGTSIARDECEILAEEKPEVRQFGVGSHFKRATADNIAALQARAKFARAIESAVLTATEEYGVSMEKFAGDDVVGNTAIDQAAIDITFGAAPNKAVRQTWEEHHSTMLTAISEANGIGKTHYRLNILR